MVKIRTSLLVAFSAIIVSTLLLSIFLVGSFLSMENKYRGIRENMILEYDITDTFSQMIDSFKSLSGEIDNEEYQTVYDSAWQELQSIFAKLDNSIAFAESKERYSKIKNAAKAVKDECDEGLANLAVRDFTKGVAAYDNAVIGDQYVRDEIAELILIEMEYSKDLMKEVESARSFTILSSTLLIIIIVIGSSIFAVVYANRLSTPLMKLSNLAEKISKGDLKQEVEEDLLKGTNVEIRTLSNSLNIMISSLKQKISELHKSNIALKKTEDKIVAMNINLEKANETLKELDKEKDEFISIAAHELKTPLTSIKGFTQLMQNGKAIRKKGKKEHYLKLINENTVRLYNLVVDLVDSSRINLGKLSLNIKNVSPDTIFHDTEENMGIIITQNGLKPVFSIGKNLPNIVADPSRVLQILRNLIVNSVHFTPKGGTISLKIYKKGNFVQFEVKDSGEGIPKDKQRFIFSRFYQADASLARKVKGSGLGLSICKGLVDMMKGKIWFESKPGKGTTFYFTIPIAKK